MQTAAKEKSFTYQRRRPVLTPCYPILAEELDKFLADRQSEGRPVPDDLAEEFEAYRKCGILSHGFLRLQRESCQRQKNARCWLRDIFLIKQNISQTLT